MLRCPVRAFPLCIPSLIALAGAALPVSSPKLVYQTPLGAGALSLAVDSQGYAYVGGSRTGCAFLTKVNQAGTAAVWSVCLPISQVSAVALDAAGYVYATGPNPLSGSAYSSTVMKLSPDAQQTVYSTVLASANSSALAVDRSGSVYVTGIANPTFQATPGAYMTSEGGGAFALKLSATGSVSYATYLDLFSGKAIAVDSQGQAWVAGTTCPPTVPTNVSNCSTGDYGIASGVRKLDAQGAKLLVTKSFGGGLQDRFDLYFDSALGIAVDGTDSVWVVGSAVSAGVPTTPGAVETQKIVGSGTGYAVRFSPSGDLLAGTYVGSSGAAINAVAVDGQGRPYFAVNLQYGPTSFDCTGTGSAIVMALAPDASAVLVTTPLSSPVLMIGLDGRDGLYTAGSSFNSAGSVAKFDLTVPGPVPPQLGAFVNAAGLQYSGGGLAPGELLTIFGTNLPPDPKVTFNGTTAPILHVSASQINLAVPFEVRGRSAMVSVDGAGDCTASLFPANPGLFTEDGSGTGQLAALNQDGSVNSRSNPAKAGSVVSVFLTGAGIMMPPIGDGQLGPLQPPYPTPILTVTATVNQVDAPVIFAGQAPLLVAGVVQVNLQIPANVTGGNAEIIVFVSGNSRAHPLPTYETQSGTLVISGV